jgi:fructose-bisphosphate aldolase, class II
MTVANLVDVLNPAIAGRYAVAGLVVLGWEDARAYVEAAEELDVPVILQAGPGCRKHTPVSILGKMFRHLAEQAKVPVVCHIDHALTVEECVLGIDNGFTSVMIDGSALPISQNIELTSRVVEIAHRAGVSVEGEVGVVGYVSGAASAHTSPDEARRFDFESGADALAISIGNGHLNTEKTSGIDFESLRAIEAVTRLPLVLHGGSGIPLDVRAKLARETRVKKFNIGTELRMAFGTSLRKYLNENPQSFDRNVILSSTSGVVKAEAKKVLLGFGGA